MLKTTKELLQELKKKGYRYYDTDGGLNTLIDNAEKLTEPLEEEEVFVIEEHPKPKIADVFIMKNGEIQDYLFTARKRVRR